MLAYSICGWAMQRLVESMNKPDTPSGEAHPKGERSYSLEGLSERDALVFKSMVRLLGHRTKYVWVYLPLSTDLKVVADGMPLTALTTPTAQQLLTLGTSTANLPGYLRLPLHANELEQELNRLGDLIIPAHRVPTTEAAMPFDASAAMQMLRWPPATLLVPPARMRLATLLTSKAMSLDELTQRAALPLPLCRAFVEDMHRAKLLRISAVAPTSAFTAPKVQHKTAQLGLLDRIRMSLGIEHHAH